MAYKVILQRLVISACVVYLPVSLAEPPSTNLILRQVQERAAKIEEYRRLLNNPDQNVRVAGLDVMLKSDDPAMREIAFNIAFASADDTMRAVALRNKFTYMKNLNFKLSLGSDPTEQEKKAIIIHFGNIYAIKLDSYDSNSGTLKFSDGRGEGQVSGTGLELQDNRGICTGNFILGEGAELVGTIHCKASGIRGTYKATLRLQ